MRATVLFLAIVLCHSSVFATTFIFKTGKSVEGTIRYEDENVIMIEDKTGVEMSLKRSSIDPVATAVANPVVIAGPDPLPEPVPAETANTGFRPVQKTYTNRDVVVSETVFRPPDPETESAWIRSISKLQRDLSRLQWACRATGTGPNLSKILRTHSYNVRGKIVKVTGYWADPANIEEAKRICNRAINTRNALGQAREGYRDFKQRIAISQALTAR